MKTQKEYWEIRNMMHAQYEVAVPHHHAGLFIVSPLMGSGVYGLYSIEDNQLLLPVEYKRIDERSPGNLFEVENQAGLKGVYSVITHEFVVPVEYDSITADGEELVLVKNNPVTTRIPIPWSDG